MVTSLFANIPETSEELKDKLSNFAMYNLDIKLEDGWQGPFEEPRDLQLMNERLKEVLPFVGDFTVYRDGRLLCLKTEGLHTYSGIIDVDQNDHIHFGSPGRRNISRIKKNWLREKSLVDGFYTPESPVYTLDGLYDTLEDNSEELKIGTLVDALEEHANYNFESIATGEKTRLKLLENSYRKHISDQ
jgi:hypothetical protein